MIPKWVQKFWDSFGSKLQPAYDKIKAWSLSPELDKLFDDIWDTLSPAIQKALWAWIEAIYKKYGEETAKKILAKNLNIMKENKVV